MIDMAEVHATFLAFPRDSEFSKVDYLMHLIAKASEGQKTSALIPGTVFYREGKRIAKNDRGTVLLTEKRRMPNGLVAANELFVSTNVLGAMMEVVDWYINDHGSIKVRFDRGFRDFQLRGCLPADDYMNEIPADTWDRLEMAAERNKYR